MGDADRCSFLEGAVAGWPRGLVTKIQALQAGRLGLVEEVLLVAWIRWPEAFAVGGPEAGVLPPIPEPEIVGIAEEALRHCLENHPSQVPWTTPSPRLGRLVDPGALGSAEPAALLASVARSRGSLYGLMRSPRGGVAAGTTRPEGPITWGIEVATGPRAGQRIPLTGSLAVGRPRPGAGSAGRGAVVVPDRSISRWDGDPANAPLLLTRSGDQLEVHLRKGSLVWGALPWEGESDGNDENTPLRGPARHTVPLETPHPFTFGATGFLVTPLTPDESASDPGERPPRGADGGELGRLVGDLCRAMDELNRSVGFYNRPMLFETVTDVYGIVSRLGVRPADEAHLASHVGDLHKMLYEATFRSRGPGKTCRLKEVQAWGYYKREPIQQLVALRNFTSHAKVGQDPDRPSSRFGNIGDVYECYLGRGSRKPTSNVEVVRVYRGLLTSLRDVLRELDHAVPGMLTTGGENGLD